MNDMEVVSEKQEEKKTFSFSKSVDGVNSSVSGREVENGWVVDIDKSWTEKDDDGNDRYKNDHKTYISKNNPLDNLKKEKKVKSKEDDTSTMLSEITSQMGMLLV